MWVVCISFTNIKMRYLHSVNNLQFFSIETKQNSKFYS